MTNSDFAAKPGDATDPIDRLTWHYENPTAEAMACAANGIPDVGITSNTVPWEMIRAARIICRLRVADLDRAIFS